MRTVQTASSQVPGTVSTPGAEDSTGALTRRKEKLTLLACVAASSLVCGRATTSAVKMRQFSTPSQHHQKFLSPGSGGGPGSRRGSGSGGIGGGGGGGSAAPMPLASSSQSRFKGIVPSPGVVKFSQWKRENEIPKYVCHMAIS